MKRTPLFAAHQKLGAKLIEFGGWEMPVQYTGIIDEHLAVRKAAGLFDISHMGEFLVNGSQAEPFLNQVLTNDVRKLTAAHGQYTLLCNNRGGVVDDLYVYRLPEEGYLLIVNASRIDADFAWLETQLSQFERSKEVDLQNVSERMGAVAVQGPRVVEFIDQCISLGNTGAGGIHKPTDLKKNQVTKGSLEAKAVWISRTGYTGEDGFEIVGDAKDIQKVWDKVLVTGAPHGLKPAGLGARDTLRTEVCYPLYGNELDEDTSPIEAGLGLFVALEKGEFSGRPTLAEQKARGVNKKLVAFKVGEKAPPPRSHYPIWKCGPGGEQIGEVTSGTQSPSLGVGIGLGYVRPEFAKPGTQLEIEVRGKRTPAVTVPKPIYQRKAD
jgi:aminomethyltransferase